MNLTKIEWCDRTFNPVTGCLHNCEYCYARKFAKRFGGGLSKDDGASLVCLEERQKIKGKYISLPYDFNPTFHKYRLNEPQKCKTPQNVFVCSMADLFGDWVPDEWIKAVFDACEKAPQHRYLFLTKNSRRYAELQNKGLLPKGENFWWGITVDKPSRDLYSPSGNVFVSYEPMIGDVYMGNVPSNAKWVIIGALSGGKKQTKNENNRIKELLDYWSSHFIVKNSNIKIFMKDSLAGIWGKELIQQYPWEV